MKKFEDKLFKVKVPKLDNDPFEHDLRRRLIKRFVKDEKSYKLQFKLATSFAMLLVIFLVVTIFKPQIISDINSFAFKTDKETLGSPLPGSNSIFLDDAINYTSIENPVISKDIDPLKYTENKSYIVRRYTSDNSEKITIVSEIDPNTRKNYKRAY
jgi:hypothetical protein